VTDEPVRGVAVELACGHVIQAWSDDTETRHVFVTDPDTGALVAALCPHCGLVAAPLVATFYPERDND
jgi:hypothetical protein